MSDGKKRLDNEELIAEFMRFSNNGAMSQMFVMHHLETCARQIIESPRPDPTKENQNSFINPAAWWDTAKEFVDLLETNRKRDVFVNKETEYTDD